MKKILVIGPTFYEINLSSKNENLASFKTTSTVGGKGYNVAHMMKLFNVPVILSTMLGNDKIGLFLKNQSSLRGIDVTPESILQHPSPIFVAIHDKKNIIFDKAQTEIFELQKSPNINWSDIFLVVVMSSTNKTVLNYLKKIKQKYPDLLFCLEMSGRKTVPNIKSHISMFDIFISNKNEAKATNSYLKKSNPSDSVKKIISTITEYGPKYAIITLDKDGVICGIKDNNKLTYIKQPIVKKNIPLHSTLGAGDSVTATFCVLHFLKGFKVKKSLSVAMSVAAEIITSEQPHIKVLPKKIIKEYDL